MNEMKKIITINTVNKDTELFLQKDNILISKIIDDNNNSQAELIIIFIEKLLKNNNLFYNDLDYISIINGPGSFISLKTAISAVKAMQVSLKIPVICNSLFDIIGYQQKYDLLVLNGDFNAYYIMDKKKNFFYVKKNEINSFVKKDSVILTNSPAIAGELKDFNVKINQYSISNIINLNFEKMLKNDFCQHIEALYIKPPQVDTKKYDTTINNIKNKLIK